MALLEVSGLRKSWGGVHALRGVSFAVDAGEMVALIGPNGAGKSTCFNLLGGQMEADGGEAVLGGNELLGRKPHEVCSFGVGRTFQVAATFGSMTVRENVRVALHFDREQSIGELLAQVGMLAQAERTCAELAYGDLKRVELALALAGRPRLLLMDEPTAGMAEQERGALMHLARERARAERIAVLFTEHDMEVVFGHADRVLALHQGELIAQGTPAAVRADARVREVYLGAA